MKNRNFSLAIFILLVLLIILFSFVNEIKEYILISFTYIFSFVDIDKQVLLNIITYIFYFLLYSLLGLTTASLFNYVCDDKLRYYFYSILIPLFIIVVGTLISTFFIRIRYFDIVIKFGCSFIGVIIYNLLVNHTKRVK